MTPSTYTPRPVIDLEEGGMDLYKKRQKELMKRLPKQSRQAQYVVNRYRTLQRGLLKSSNIEDPNPYNKGYIFYCMTLTDEK